MKPTLSRKTKAALKTARAEVKFYRELLEQIASHKRNTIAKRLAESGLMFLDVMRKEAKRRKLKQ